MKQVFSLFFIAVISIQQVFACGWYESEYEYFNLFTQSIIKNTSYTPFLLTYDVGFYEDKNVELPDDNITSWHSYFNDKLSVAETKELVYNISLEELNKLKKGQPLNNSLLQRLGYNFYTTYQDEIDYLIEAKYLAPYMRIRKKENTNTYRYYGYHENSFQTVADLDYTKIISDLSNLYDATDNKEIKLRYGYQLVRFNHYNRNYEDAIVAFNKYVEPLNLKTTPYYMALEQLAGAQLGVGFSNEANWNFFQVFQHTNSRKVTAYQSIQVNRESDLNYLLEQAQSDEEKMLIYFLLGYQDFNYPLPMMKKIYEIDPTSDLLTVLEARSINELERGILLLYYSYDPDLQNENQSEQQSDVEIEQPQKEKTHQTNLFQKIIQWFKNLFGGNPSNTNKNNKSNKQYIQKSDKEILNDEKRIPIFVNQSLFIQTENDNIEEIEMFNYFEELEKLTADIRDKSEDEFWDISYAYLQFLKKNYEKSESILTKISTKNPNYIAQIDRLKMLNEIVSQPIIDAQFEDHMMQKYADVLIEEKLENDKHYYYKPPSTREFIIDVLANRYFLQQDYAKSFLLTHPLDELNSRLDYSLIKDVEAYYNKPNKTEFELNVINTALNLEDPNSYIHNLYGDYFARQGEFATAKTHYEQVTNRNGFVVKEYEQWNGEKGEYETVSFPINKYDYFANVSSYVFGTNHWVSYNSPEFVSLRKEPFVKEFNFIPNSMNKRKLMDVLIELQTIGNGKDTRASWANQLIGNFMYNTSKIGYFRHLLVSDLTNGNGGKYHFSSPQSENDSELYYKDQWFLYENSNYENKNAEIANKYYKKALSQTDDKEQEAQLLFQLASVEQLDFYEWEAKQPPIRYEDYANYNSYIDKVERREQEMHRIKLEKFSTYFERIKNEYETTETIQEIESNCQYLHQFLIN